MTMPISGPSGGRPGGGAAPAPSPSSLPNPPASSGSGAAPSPPSGSPSRAPAAAETFPIASSGDVHVAVSKTARLAMLAEASEVDRSLIATMVSELARNIVKYAQRGVVRVSRHEHPGGIDIDVEAEDSGPGIGDVALALRDHYSTGGTLGLGLPGVRRMADRFAIRSQPQAGTLVTARKRISERAVEPLEASTRPVRTGTPDGSPEQPEGDEPQPLPTALPRYPDSGSDGAAWQGAESLGRWDVGSRVRPCVGHLLSGDAVAVAECADGLLLGIIDVSGHGPGAHAVARRAVNLIMARCGPDLIDLMGHLHRELRGTAGAAIGLMFVEPALQRFRYLGVGNTRAAKSGRQPWRGVSRDGVVGDRAPSPFEQQAELHPGDTILLWTDGIPELAGREFANAVGLRAAGEIARGLVDRLARPYDDAACVVLKWLR